MLHYESVLIILCSFVLCILLHYDTYSGYIEPGLAMWTQDSGIQPFPGGGLSFVQPIGDER
jgi:hypothetical protein